MPTQPPCLDDRLRAGDKELFSVLDHEITINECHSFILGLVGLPIAAKGMTLRTIKHEPWYFVGAFVVSYLIGKRLRN